MLPLGPFAADPLPQESDADRRPVVVVVAVELADVAVESAAYGAVKLSAGAV